MKRERTEHFDVFRLADSISIVERKSGACVASFAITSEEVRAALVRLLSEPLKTPANAPESAPKEADPEPDPTPEEPEKPEKKPTKKRTTKNTKDAT